MQARRQQWAAEKPVYSGGNELRFSTLGGELVFGYFVSSGEDADQFINIYKGHAVPTVTSKGIKISVVKFCPILSGVGEQCAYCDAGNTDFKDRMAMWLYISDILHTNLPAEKQFPTVPYGGRVYFREEVNAFKLWYSSAWKESPWDDIVRFHTLYKGLHNFMWQMVVSGAGMARRYKMYAMPEPAQFTAEMYEKAKQECRPIPELLKESLAGPVQAAPAVAEQQTFTPGAAAPGPTILQAFAPGLPGGAPTAAAPKEAPPGVLPPVTPEEDSRRPLKSMF